MIHAKLRKLAYVLVETVGDRKIKSLQHTGLNRMDGEYFNQEGTVLPLHIEYFPKYKSMKSSTDLPRMSNYRIDVVSVEGLEDILAKGTTHEELSKEIMTKEELYEKLKKGEMTFELKGHYAGYNGNNEPMIKHFTESYIRQHERNKEGAAGKHDGTWELRDGDTMEERNKSMRNYYARKLEWGFSRNAKIFESMDDKKCSACGKSLEIVLKDENTLSVYPGYHMQEEGDFRTVCKYPSGPPHAHGEIEVNGDLIFANFFTDMKEDCPPKEKYKDKYDLCSFSGRRNITEWKCKNQNVAYGQMGNMSLSVWYNKKENHIVLTECWMEETPKKLSWLKKKGFKQMGDSISLSVWRWEATDVPTLCKVAEKDITKIVNIAKKDYQDTVVFPVKHGTWEFTHYYDTTPDSDSEVEPFIYAELKLKTND